jgi:hypothetical protein
LIETNHAQALAYVGTGNVLGEGVVFGADAYACAEGITPELRAGIPQDYGRLIPMADGKPGETGNLSFLWN